MKTLIVAILLVTLFLFCGDKNPTSPPPEDHGRFELNLDYLIGAASYEGSYYELWRVSADIQYPPAFEIWGTNGYKNYNLEFEYYSTDDKYTYYLIGWPCENGEIIACWATSY